MKKTLAQRKYEITKADAERIHLKVKKGGFKHQSPYDL